MRARIALFSSILLVWALVQGCGDDKDRNPPPNVGDFLIFELEDDYVEPEIPIEGPIVEIVSPSEGMDLLSEHLITTSLVRVECRVTENALFGRRVDKTSITIELTAPDGAVLTAVGQPSLAADLYVADFNLSEQKNGAVKVTCKALDIGTPAYETTAEVNTFLDLGPTILVLSPVNAVSYARQLNVFFRADIAPVSEPDPGADIDPSSIKVFVAGKEIPGVTLDDRGNYTVNFQFDDPNLFTVPLDGASSLVIEVANSRGSSPVKRRQEVLFNADSSGALITFVQPLVGDLVGGIFDVRVTIEDPAGVDPNSVVAKIGATNSVQLLYNATTQEYEGRFDGRNLGYDVVFPLLVVTATDLVGNENSFGQNVALDNRMPLVDLDSPPIREVNEEDECSEIFDPLGSDAPDDGERVPQLSEFRVRVEDRANGEEASSTSLVVPMAGVAPEKVQLFVLADETGALVVDTDGDGICDDINPLIQPSSVPDESDEAAVINLVQLSPEGGSYYPFQLSGPDFGASDWLVDTGCKLGSENEPPDPICRESSAATRIIKDVVEDVGVIFAIPPVSDVNCMGSAFDAVGSNIADGWACVAVRAEDRLGNVGVSRPLRACFDRDGNRDLGCTCENAGLTDFHCSQAAGLPNCTGIYDSTSNAIIPGSTCQLPPNFRSSVARYRNVRVE